MKKGIVFICVGVLLQVGVVYAVQAQSAEPKTDREGLVLALSEHAEFQEFYQENLRFLQLKEAGALSAEEEAEFYQEQGIRVENIKAHFPQYATLEKEEAAAVVREAFLRMKHQD